MILRKLTGDRFPMRDADAQRTIFTSSIVVTRRVFVNIQHDNCATESSTEDYHQLWLAGRRASGCCRTVSSTNWARYCNLLRKPTPLGSEARMVDRRGHDLHRQPCRHVEVLVVGLRLAAGSRIAETPAEMAPLQ